MNDKLIRVALRQKVFPKYLARPGCMLLEEVGIRHGSARIDFIVLNGSLHGFEVKSDRDKLDRLPDQARIYNSVLDKITLVVGYRHADAAIKIIPEWWGVKLASPELLGSVCFTEARRPYQNPITDKLAVAKLLWREEALDVLKELGCHAGMASKTRKKIYEKLAACADLDLIRKKARYYLNHRAVGRVGAPQKLSDG